MPAQYARSLWGIIVLAAFLLPQSAWSEHISPELIKVTTPVYRPDFDEFEQNLGRYEYRVSWQGIPAADAVIDVDEDGLNYKITTTVETYSAIDIFYKLRYRAEGLLSGLDLMPERMTVEHRENSRKKSIDMQFRDDGTIHSVYTFRGQDSEVFDFNPNNFTLDPFSAAFLARSLDWNIGDTKQFDCFNGKSRYLISLTAEDRIRTFINGENRDVWVIAPNVTKLNDPTAEKKLREAKIYVSADRARDILQIKSEVFIGNVYTKLVSFTPSDKPPLSARLAQARSRLFK
jgi:hypothetical protein